MSYWQAAPITASRHPNRRADHEPHNRQADDPSRGSATIERRGDRQGRVDDRRAGAAGHRAANGRARHHDRQRRAANDPGQGRLLHQRNRLGRQWLRVDLRRPAAARRAQRRHARTPARVRGRAGGVRARLGGRRGGSALAPASGGLASSPTMLIVARVVQGASAAFAQATALSLIVSTFPAGAARNRAVGVFAAMEGLGAAAGLLLGGLIVEYISWRWVFFLNVPVAASAALLAPRLIPAPTRGRAVFDLPGAATATVGLGLLVFGLSGAADHGWTTALTLGPILAGLLALATFVGLEARSKQPLMPFWVFRDRNRGGAYLIQALLGAALFGMFFLSTLFLQHVLGYSPLKAGAAFIPLTVVMIASAGLVSKLVVHTGVRPLIATGTAIAAIGLLWLSNLTPHSSYMSGAMLPLIMVGIGLGMTFVPATLSAVSGVKEEDSGLVSGVSLTAIQIGGAVGLALLATVAATTTAHQAPGTPLPQALTAGYTRAFEVSALIIALAV